LKDLDSDDAKSSCDPIWKNRDINNKFTKSFDQSTTLDPEDVVVPCGLFPYYFFSGTVLPKMKFNSCR
jgi:hypothetical protein